MILQPVERRFLVWLCVAVVLLTSAPYFFGWLATPSNRTYTGIHRLTPGDVAVYYSFIEQGRQGHLISRNLYSSEPQSPAVITPQWFVLGQIANLFRFSTVAIYQLARIGFGLLFIILAYRFLANYIADLRTRRIVATVAVFATGFGSFIPISDMSHAVQTLGLPVDMWVPEAFPFLTLYHNPQFLMALCLLLAILLLTLKYFIKPWRLLVWGLSGLALLLALVHPYDVFLLAAILLGWLVIWVISEKRRAPIKKFITLSACMLAPAVIYLGVMRIIFEHQPALRGWAHQNITLSPALWWYIPAYIVPVILAIIGIRSFMRSRSAQSTLVLGWVAVVPILLYFPGFPYQRRMLEGWFIPLVILAAFGVLQIWSWIKKHIRSSTIQSAFVGAAFTLGILLTLPTSLTHMINDAWFASFGKEPIYVPAGLPTAAVWLREHTTQDDIILAQPFDSNLIPGWSGRTVYYGHDDLTANSVRKSKEVEEFFTASKSPAAKTFLKQADISYLFIRRTDAEILFMIQKKELPAQLVYENPDVLLYHILP